MEDPGDAELLTPRQAAVLLGVAPSTVIRWLRKEKLKPAVIHPTGRYRIARADVNALRPAPEVQPEPAA